MAESLTIARPYAEAAFASARDENALGAWYDALARLATVAAHPHARELTHNPRVAPAQAAAALADVAGGLTPSQRNFVALLAENERLDVLPQVAEQFAMLRNGHEGVLDARVTSAFPMTVPQIDALRVTLAEKFGRQVQVTTDVDPELIGGVSIRVGDQVMDASVRGKLAQLASALAR